jgi:tetratricopeptide (TPR) repeat protein
MKNSNWLDVTEYLLLVGSGVGSLAAIASQQVAFTAAPLSLLMAVNLANRRRLEGAMQTETETAINQLDRRLTKQVVTLDQQVQELPSYSDLKGLRQQLQDNQTTAIAEIGQAVSRRLAALESCDLGQMQYDLSELRSEQAQFNQSLAIATAHLNRLATTQRVDEAEGTIAQLKLEVNHLRKIISEIPKTPKLQSTRALQDQIDHLNRRLNHLPQPSNTNTLKQEMDGVLKLMGDLVSRRELAKMMTEMEKIRQQQQTMEHTVAPMKAVNTIMRKQLDTLATWVRPPETADGSPLVEGAAVAELRQAIAALESQLQNLPQDLVGHVTQVQSDLQAMTSHLEDLQTQINEVEQQTQTLDRQQKTLGEWVSRLPQLLDSSALQGQIKHLTARMGLSEAHLADLQHQVMALVEGNVNHLSTESAADYQLVFDLQATQSVTRTASVNSRELIETALETAQSSLVIVFPYPDPRVLNRDLIQQFQAFIQRGGNLSIGWGHLDHLPQYQQSRYIYQNQLQPQADRLELQAILSQLTDLKRQYSQQFRFKVLGTDENFLVCDDTYALLGIHPLPTASALFPQVAVGLRTTRSEVIQQLIDRFHEPVLDGNDVASFFNRAITRYELGDKAGAIADYTEVLRIDTNHDVAYNNRALVQYELGHYNAAIADFEQALLVNSRNAIAYCNRGIVRGELSNRLGAIEDYTYAIQIDGDCLPAYFQRGLARNRMGNKMGAIADFGEVIRINPEDASAFFYRGLAKTKLGDRIGAIRDLKESAWLFSAQGNHIGHQQATEAITKLRKRTVITGSQEKRA